MATINFVAKRLAITCLLLGVITQANSQCSDVTDACQARVPQLLKFSGVLRDASPLDGTLGVTFALYNEFNGGVPLWQETQNINLDQQGHYASLLGTGSLEGVPPGVSSGDPRWLGGRAELPGESEQPRTRWVSTPYALKAADAQTLGGFPPSAFVRVTPNNSEQMTSFSGSELANARAQSVMTVVGTGQSTGQAVNPGVRAANAILFAEQFPGGVPDAVAACPPKGCIIYAISPKVNLNLGKIDPGSKAVTIYLGPYTYNATQITLRRDLQVIGMGSGITFLQSVNGNDPVVVVPQEVDGAATNVLLSGFRLIGSVGNTSEDAMFWDSSGHLNSGVWYSEVRDIFIIGFAGNSIHLIGTNANFTGESQWVEFNRVIVFRAPGGGNGLRIEGAAYELYFNDCQFDGNAPGDGTNIFIGARPGNAYAFPVDINFRALTSQNAATAVQLDGGWAISFYSPHHEYVWGVYQIDGDLGAPTQALTISDAQFLTVGANNGAGFLLKVNTPFATVRLLNSQITEAVDAVVLSPYGASVEYKDNEFHGGTNLPLTRGITTALDPASTININGAHSISLTSSTIPITTIQSSLGAGEMATFFALNGPVTFGEGGNINLTGGSTLTVHGSVTFMVSDIGSVPVWIPVSQWRASSSLLLRPPPRPIRGPSLRFFPSAFQPISPERRQTQSMHPKHP